MVLPTNVTEEQALQAINDVASSLSPRFVFGYYDVDDIEQHVRMELLKIIHRYDNTKGASLKTFLYNHARNRLLTLRRDKYMRPAPKDLSEDELEEWNKKHSVKKNLIDSLSGEMDDQPLNSESESLDSKELKKVIDRRLPVEFRGDYQRFMDGVKLPKQRKLKLIEVLREIVTNEYLGEKEGQAEPRRRTDNLQ
jgi:DNA-directed RNA polymerase specialized sigma24 family protein